MSDLDSMPVLRISLERMKIGILKAFHEQSMSLDLDVRAAVEQFCTAENLREIIQQHAEEELRAAIARSVKSYFGYGGAGYKAVEGYVEAMLNVSAGR